MRVFVISRDETVTLILGPKHYVRTGEEGVKLYKAAQAYRANRIEENLQNLEDLVNPYSKYVRDGVLRETNGNLFLGESKVALPAALAEP